MPHHRQWASTPAGRIHRTRQALFTPHDRKGRPTWTHQSHEPRAAPARSEKSLPRCSWPCSCSHPPPSPHVTRSTCPNPPPPPPLREYTTPVPGSYWLTWIIALLSPDAALALLPRTRRTALGYAITAAALGGGLAPD